MYVSLLIHGKAKSFVSEEEQNKHWPKITFHTVLQIFKKMLSTSTYLNILLKIMKNHIMCVIDLSLKCYFSLSKKVGQRYPS